MIRPRMVFPFLAVLMTATASAQSNVVITEPGVYKLDELFKAADAVAVVKVLSGDTENYEKAVYKGEVIQSFKGTATGQTVYFGPFIGERLGWEYVLFLRNSPKPATPKKTANAPYGAVQYSEVFDEGYSSMETSYECVFQGKESAQRCDYAVRVCTDYIKLPKTVSTSPPEENDPPFGCRWVRKSIFLELLEALGSLQ
jgi:hypothetical protein